MTTSATAPDLPSSDEEDDDYVPGAAEDGASGEKSAKRKKATPQVRDATTGGSSKAAAAVAAVRASKQAKRVDDIWSKLRAQSGGSASTSAPSSAPQAAAAAGGGGSGSAAQPGGQKGGGFSLAAFCRPVPRLPKGTADQSWRKQFGLDPKPPAAASSAQPDAKAIAAAAIEAAKSLSTTDQYGRTIVTETRKFAGQNVQIKKSVAAGGEQQAAVAPVKATGLDAMLAAIQGAKKVTVLDKSQADWDEHKKNAGDNADLAEHNRSANRYLDRQDFLARSEVREYEKERDARLNSDVRNRSRA